MTCDDARESLSALLDEALTSDERRAVETHLEGCAECRRELDRLRETVALLHRVSPAHAPAGFVDRVVAAAQPTPWYRRAFFPLWAKLPVEATAVVMVALLAVYTFQRTPALQQAARYEAPAPSGPAETPAPLGDVRKEQESRPALRDAPSLALGARSAERGRDATVARESKRPPESAPAATPPPVASPGPAVPAPAPPSVPAPATPAPPPAQSGEAPATARSDAPPTAKTEAPAAKSAAPAENVTGAARPETDARRQALDRAGGASRVAPAVPGVAAKRAPPSADLVARVAVKDRDAAERELASLIARVDGRQTQRRREDDATVVEALIPQSRYPEFSQALAAIGPWRVEAERPDLPSQVHVILRLE
jgi:putative zinc finger protein